MSSSAPMPLHRRTFLQLAGALATAAAATGLGSAPALAKPRRSQAGVPVACDLIDEDFFVILDRNGINPSGWDVRQAGGATSYAYGKWFRVADQNAYLPVIMTRRIHPQTAPDLTLEFRFTPLGPMDGTRWELRGGGTAAVALVVEGDELRLVLPGDTRVGLATCSVGTEVGVRVVHDLPARRVSVEINGVTVVQGAATVGVDSVDSLVVTSGRDQSSDMYFGPVRLYRGYLLRETFVPAVAAARPDRWSLTGTGATAAVVRRPSQGNADPYSLRVDTGPATGPATLATAAPALTGLVICEARCFIGGAADGFRVRFRLDAQHLLTIDVAADTVRVLNASGTAAALRPYARNVWLHLRAEVDLGTGTAALRVNGKPVAEGVDLVTAADPDAPTGVMITVPPGVAALIDDVIIKRADPVPADYPGPPAVQQQTGLAIGVTEFAGWREGHHFGWDVINPYRSQRKPLLGWYDEGSVEVTDWELKWLIENGVSFRMACWFRPHDGTGTAIKLPRLHHALHDGFFNARYSDQLLFAIMWENVNGGRTDSQDFRTNVVPFWIDYYFTDPRYLVIDNKPVLSVFRAAALINSFGTVEGVRAEIDFLDQALRDRGFDGVHVITALATATTAAMGVVGEHRYSTSVYPSTQRLDLERQRDSGAVPVVPTIGMGLDGEPWTGNPGAFVDPADYRELLAWLRAEYLPSLDAGALGRKLLILDNWNEYGEGHFLMPSTLHEFGYLNAVRDVFGQSSAPNVSPTAAQLARLQWLYPPGRSFAAAVATGPDRSTDFTPAWEFDSDGDTEGWAVLKEIDGLSVTGGALTGSTATNDPAIEQQAVLGLQAAEYPYAEVRLRMSPAVGAQLFWMREGDTDYHANRCVTVRVESDNADFQTVELPLWRSGTWTGKINKLRFDPINHVPGSFEIDYLRLMKVPVPAPRLTVAGVLFRTPAAVVDESGRHAVPLEAVVRGLGGRAERSTDGQDLAVVLGRSTLECRIGRTDALRNGAAYSLTAAPVAGADGVPRVLINDLADALAVDWSFDEATQTLAIDVAPLGQELRVVPDGSGDFRSPALAVAAITDSGPERPYTISVAPGTYTETEWIVPPYVTLRGDDRDTCILAGSLPDSAPDSAINATSTLWLQGTATLENLTITATNLRYAVHSEKSGANRDAVHVVTNCRIEHTGNDGARAWRTAHPESGLSPSTVWASDRPWGYGSGSGVRTMIKDCVFVGPKEPWYLHTNKDFSKPTINELTGCTFTLTGDRALPVLRVQSMGSGQPDSVVITDSTFTGLIIQHDDRPWISTAPERQVSDHAEIAVSITSTSLLGYRPNLRSRALRFVAANPDDSSPITVSGDAAPLVLGDLTLRAGGGGVAGYGYGSWDISGIAVGLGNDVVVANTLGRRLGDCATHPRKLILTVGSNAPVTISFSTDVTGADNGTILELINDALAGTATAELYDVGRGESYPTFPDRERSVVNTGPAGIARWSAVAGGGDGVVILGDDGADPIGVVVEQLAPGARGRLLTAGLLANVQLAGLAGTTIPAGATVYHSATRPGEFSLTGAKTFGTAKIENWVEFDLR
ncbi:stalk domain-containing protein [Microlunatus sp. GCM10028923]|uniref:stalk domain-containing protein n=1 Tax=Microlunatus sp. GCM10028923 TaxID=3273400 RepID=UPI00360B4A5F